MIFTLISLEGLALSVFLGLPARVRSRASRFLRLLSRVLFQPMGCGVAVELWWAAHRELCVEPYEIARAQTHAGSWLEIAITNAVMAWGGKSPEESTSLGEFSSDATLA